MTDTKISLYTNNILSIVFYITKNSIAIVKLWKHIVAINVNTVSPIKINFIIHIHMLTTVHYKNITTWFSDKFFFKCSFFLFVWLSFLMFIYLASNLSTVSKTLESRNAFSGDNATHCRYLSRYQTHCLTDKSGRPTE